MWNGINELCINECIPVKDHISATYVERHLLRDVISLRIDDFALLKTQVFVIHVERGLLQ